MTKCVKCKYCEELIPHEDRVTIEVMSVKGNLNKANLHQNCLQDYNELTAYRNEETLLFDELYNHIKSLLNYTEQQQLPRYLITRLQDLRNGTITIRGHGRVNKSKDGYTHPVILDTFLACGDDIRWSFENKKFNDEKGKIAYMMAIIDSNINDSYIRAKSKLDVEIIKKRDNMMEEESNLDLDSEICYNQNIIIKKNNGISKFLEEDEL